MAGHLGADLHEGVLLNALLDHEAIVEMDHMTQVVLISLHIEVVGTGMHVAKLCVVAELIEVLDTLMPMLIINIEHLSIRISYLTLAVPCAYLLGSTVGLMDCPVICLDILLIGQGFLC